MTSKTRERLQAYLASLRAKGRNPDRETWIIDIFGKWTHGVLGKSPCLTRTRAADGGHWITTRSRLMSVPEMLRLQGMSPALNCVGITERQMGCMIGNAMSVNVLERLLVRLLPGGLGERHLPSRPLGMTGRCDLPATEFTCGDDIDEFLGCAGLVVVVHMSCCQTYLSGNACLVD